MVKQDNLNYRLGFRADDQLLEGLERLSAKFKLGQSEVVRMGIKRLMESYLDVEGDIIILEKGKWDLILNKFLKRIEGEPERTEKAIKEVVGKVTANLAEKLKQEGVLK